MVKQKIEKSVKNVSLIETEKVEIPKYVLEGNQNIPEDLKKVIDYFRDCGNKNYQVCLVGKKETLKTDFQNVNNDIINIFEKNKKLYDTEEIMKNIKEAIKIPNKISSDYPFIHLTDKNTKNIYSFLPVNVKNSIKRINRMISNPENSFNKTYLGIHTLGLVPISQIKNLNNFGYGLTYWNNLEIFVCCSGSTPFFECPSMQQNCVCNEMCRDSTRSSAWWSCVGEDLLISDASGTA